MNDKKERTCTIAYRSINHAVTIESRESDVKIEHDMIAVRGDGSILLIPIERIIEITIKEV